MKYFTITGEHQGEIFKKLQSQYGGKAVIFKTVTEEKPEKSFGLFKKTKKLYKAYCGLPESKEELDNIENNRLKQKEIKIPKNHEKKESLSLFVHNNDGESLEQNSPEYGKLFKEMEELKSMFVQFVNEKVDDEDDEQTKLVLEKCKEYMIENDFSYSFIKNFFNGLTVPVLNLETFKIILKEKIRLNIGLKEGLAPDDGRFVILLGPTGVGKTTTLAKLASIYFFNHKKKVRFLTFDTFRLGAAKQLELYAQIFNQPFHLINSDEDLKAVLKVIEPDEVVLVDTAGESLIKDIKFSEIQKWLKLFPEKVIKILTISSSVKSSDLIKINEKFQPLNYDYYIMSKLDETNTIGPIVELLYKKAKPLIYFTTGQSVPEDIKTAKMDDILEFL